MNLHNLVEVADGVAIAAIAIWAFVHIRAIGWKQATGDAMTASVLLVALLLAVRLSLHEVNLANLDYDPNTQVQLTDLVTDILITALFTWRIFIWRRGRRLRD